MVRATENFTDKTYQYFQKADSAELLISHSPANIMRSQVIIALGRGLDLQSATRVVTLKGIFPVLSTMNLLFHTLETVDSYAWNSWCMRLKQLFHTLGTVERSDFATEKPRK